MAAFAGRALFNCLWLTVACAEDRRSAAFRSPFVLGWYRRLPREIMCQSGRKSGAQLDIHTLECVCVCARVYARKREHAHSAVHTLMHLCSETTNAETPIWHPPTRLHVEHIGGCICLGYIHTQAEEEQTYSMLKHVNVHTCPALSKLSTPTHASKAHNLFSIF